MCRRWDFPLLSGINFSPHLALFQGITKKKVRSNFDRTPDCAEDGTSRLWRDKLLVPSPFFFRYPLKTKNPALLRPDSCVPKMGLEPIRPKTHAPETCASTNSATSAGCYLNFEDLRNRFFTSQFLSSSILCTEGGNRTRTMLPSLDFESSASTNSATSAGYFILRNQFLNSSILCTKGGNRTRIPLLSGTITGF